MKTPKFNNRFFKSSILSLSDVNFDSLFSVCKLPGGMKNQSGAFFKKFILNFVRRVCMPVIICMNTVKIENHRNIILGKVIMVTSEVKTIRVIVGIEFIIKFESHINFVYFFRKIVKFLAKSVCANQVNVVRVILLFRCNATNHVNI